METSLGRSSFEDATPSFLNVHGPATARSEQRFVKFVAHPQALCAIVAAVLFGSQAPIDAGVGLDPSWEAGLALAQAHHLAWGTEIVFTHGPLGFLRSTAYYSVAQAVLATTYQLSVVGALFLGIAKALRQRRTVVTSLVGAFAVTGIVTILQGGMHPELAVLAAFAWASVPLLQEQPKQSTVLVTCVALGAVAGLQLMIKFNTAPTILVIALAVSLLLGWRAVGRHCATVASFVASALSCWILAGQGLGKLPIWLKLSATVTSGYLDAMAERLGLVALPVVALVVAWLCTVCAIAVRGKTQIPRRFLVLVVLVTLITAKVAFGRFDVGHVFILISLVVVAVAITPVPEKSHRVLVAVGVAVCVVIAALGIPGGPSAVAPSRAIERLLSLASPGHVAQRIEQAKAHQRAVYAVPVRFIDTIGSGTVHIDPDEASVAWAYNLAWQPAPVFQEYSDYAPALDALNSNTLADGPQYVLSRQSPSSPATDIDGRLAVQESPLYSRALLCDYTLSSAKNRWALFTHSGSHCGALTKLSEVAIHGNDTVIVPAPSGPGMAVLVGIDLDKSVLDRLFQGTIAPMTTVRLVLDGGSYRLISANAAEPFLVKTPASVEGTNLRIDAHKISVGDISSLGQADVAARLRFYEMPVGP